MAEGEEIEVSFGFFDPKPSDAPGIAVFIPKYLNCERVNLSSLVANQSLVGTTIKDEEDEEGQSLFGFVSAINLGFYHENPCIAQFVDWLMSLGNSELSEFISCNMDTTALFLNERAYGTPPEMAPHLMRGVLKEIEWATEDAGTEEERASFQLTHLIMVKKAVKEEEGSIEFQNIEDEMFFNRALIKVEFDTEGEEGDLADLEYHRYVIVVTMEAAQEVRATLNEMFGISEEQYAGEDAC